MTRARALKQAIRARAVKTGERYTTARRHILKELAEPTGVARSRRSRPAASAPAPPERPVPNLTKGAVRDERVRQKTGHGLDHWFTVLDTFGGPDKGHSALARHLHDDHDVSGWYAQGITVAYERARGVRALNQRVSGEYEVSVTRTVGGHTRAVARAFSDPTRRAYWLAEADADLAEALSAALALRASKSFVIRADGLGRFRYTWDTTTVQLYLVPKGEGRTSVVVAHMKLADAPTLERRRAQWRIALAALARHVD
jgi:hypothetical protein